MALTAKERQENFIAEVNKIGVLSIAWLDAPGAMQAGCLWMADGGQRFWKVRNDKVKEFEEKINFVEN